MTASQPAERVLPLLPLRDVVVFPHMVIPLFVGRPKSIKALEAAMEEGKNVVLVAQKSAAIQQVCSGLPGRCLSTGGCRMWKSQRF